MKELKEINKKFNFTNFLLDVMTVVAVLCFTAILISFTVALVTYVVTQIMNGGF